MYMEYLYEVIVATVLSDSDLGSWGCLFPREKATDRQTDRHGRAHNLFFARARA
jgi:hypothetical protein